MVFLDKHKYSIEYLLDNANEAIKYRVMTELCDVQCSEEIETLRKAVINSDRYKKLVRCLRERKEYRGFLRRGIL